ncbi:DUF423 domain-containing protein [Aquimarina pacifica]|uniref:DUF423 domain-containing protein n=1 Tax=Aquimarina pacifica TaxID=1296415 RepID=UPI00046EA0B4|nr:DUF423 domain-containing protein [Aquimarina pacifica]
MNTGSLNKTILITGAILGLLAVILGAFGAHGLEKLVDANNIDSFATGTRYQMYHAIFCLFLANINTFSERSKKRIFSFIISGILLFSGSIYLLVVDEIFNISLSSIGFITPLGGLLLILGWVFLLISCIKIK